MGLMKERYRAHIVGLQRQHTDFPKLFRGTPSPGLRRGLKNKHARTGFFHLGRKATAEGGGLPRPFPSPAHPSLRGQPSHGGPCAVGRERRWGACPGERLSRLPQREGGKSGGCSNSSGGGGGCLSPCCRSSAAEPEPLRTGEEPRALRRPLCGGLAEEFGRFPTSSLPMEPAAAAAATAGLFLAGSEQQFYAELFALCCGGSCQTVPEAGTGAAPAAGGSKVAELFRASQLPPETLHQVLKGGGSGPQVCKPAKKQVDFEDASPFSQQYLFQVQHGCFSSVIYFYCRFSNNCCFLQARMGF
ncbi:uncharacterized protein LOC125431329 [Sphaerodactylus townsendi]|uniref:uncharacterized protein LOC125431329 n=1 Tax=Sphaerodactylus townsendi TaxID=933632 RepID=UPI00202680EC|nr:uncharacterized protein LOC125431329 [Sphaerodactylus townsendi]